MFCKYCGKQTSDSSKYCSECGAPIVVGAMGENQPDVIPSEYDALEQVASADSGEKATLDSVSPLCAEQNSAPPIQAPLAQDRVFYAPPAPPIAPPKYKAPDASSIGYAFLCFFFPMAGLILYLVWKEDYPLRAKSCGKGALVSVILNIVSFILMGIVYFFLIIALINAAPAQYVLLGLL